MRSFLTVLLSAAVLAAQNPPEAGITFKTTTQLVIVNVAARDKDGNSIEGLTASDFTVLEDGKPQTIVAFEYQKLDEQPLPRALVAPRGEAAGVVEGVAKAPAVIVSSAPGEVRYKDRRLLVMFFDLASMPPPEMWRSQSAALKFLREQITASDLVAVMSYTKQLDVLQDFTDDRDQLIKVIESLAAGDEDDLFATDEDTEDADAEFSIFNTDRKLAALEDALRMLGSLAERKALVYFAAGSGGGTGTENQSQLRSTINAAVRGNVAFYPVDARGLVAQAPMGNAASASPGGIGVYSGDAARQTAIQLGGEDETLYRLAKETGGKSLVDTNDLTLGLREAQKDLSSYYILGYYSSNADPDGKYRRIKVDVSRKLAASLDYRNGYFTSKLFANFTAADRERQLEEALLLGDPITDIGVALEVDYFQVQGNRYFVPLAVKIPGSAIEFPEGGGGTRLDFIAQVKNVTGAVAATVRDNIEIKLPAEAAAQLANRTVHYDTAFLLTPGPYTLKFVTRENVTGKMGTFETGFFVPDLATEVDYLPISSVVLSNHRENITEAVGTRKKERGKPVQHPLVQGGEKLIPSVTRVFRKDQQMYVYLEAYQPPAGESPSPVTVRVGFYRGNLKAFESEPLQVSADFDPLKEGVPVKLSVPLETLQPGRYTCQVSVLAPAAQKFAFWRAPIVLLP